MFIDIIAADHLEMSSFVEGVVILFNILLEMNHRVWQQCLILKQIV